MRAEPSTLDTAHKLPHSPDRAKEGIFPHEWKKANIVPVHEKAIHKSYQIVSLPLACSKIFERPIHNSMYKRISDNNPL